MRMQETNLDDRLARLEECSRNLNLPTLLVRGGLSDVLSEDGARRFLDLCPHSEYVNVTGAAHMVAGDRNDIFADAVIEFLRRAVPVDREPRQPPHHPQPHHTGPPNDIVDLP
jgi:non-heme chloroperoxidase